MPTIYDATQSGPVICAMGENRTIVLGDVQYRFKRNWFTNGMAETLPRFARGIPVMWVDGRWQEISSRPHLIVEWSRQITPIAE